MDDMMYELIQYATLSPISLALAQGFHNRLQDTRREQSPRPAIIEKFKDIMKGTAEDIKSCWAACDAYLKTNSFVKVINGPLWDRKLVKFLAQFDYRRGEIQSNLNFYVMRQQANDSQCLNEVRDIVSAVNAK